MALLLAFVIVPIVEIALFVEAGGAFGLWPTLAIVLATALLGSTLLRAQGLAALGGLRQRLASGEDPGRVLADGALILVAGVLLLTPGFMTDALGLSLLVPPIRARVIAFLARRIHVVQAGRADPRRPARDQTIDGDYVDVTADRAEGEKRDP